MPTSTKSKKDLYLGNCVGDLNKQSEKIPPVTNVKQFVSASHKVFQKAEHENQLGDEEQAYVLYMKYFNLICAIKKSPQYKKNENYYKELIGTSNSSKAINEAERLVESLKNRYEEREAKKLIEKNEEKEKLKKEAELEAAANDKTEKDGKEKEEEEKKPDEEKKEAAPPLKTSVTARELYTYMQNKDLDLLIMDMRASEEYNKSHILYHQCINVPADIAPPGCTTTHIESSLPPDSRNVWLKRKDVDNVILLDFNSSAEEATALGTPLKSLTDALYKWDRTVILRSHPLVLDGGYNSWLWTYPTYTTNPNAVTKQPLHATYIPTLPTLENIDYDLELNFLKDPEEEKVIQPTSEASSQEPGAHPSVPVIDRSNKPNQKPIQHVPVTTSVIPVPSNVTSVTSNDDQLSKAMNGLGVGSESSKPANNRPEIPALSQINTSLSEVKPSAPVVNRGLKPKVVNSNPVAPADVANTISHDEANSSAVANGDVDDEVASRDSDIAAAKLDYQIEQSKRDLQEIENKKNKEVKATADIMRKKREVENELAALEEQRAKYITAQNAKAATPTSSANSSPRKHPAATVGTPTAASRTAAAAGVGADGQATSKLETNHNKERQLAEERQKRIELEKQKEIERKRKEAEALAAKEKERQEKERKEETLEKQLLEKRQKELERTREAGQQRERQRIEKEQEIERQRNKEKQNMINRQKQIAGGGVKLPVGWEKRLNHDTGTYYYINNNNNTTHASPPEPPKHQGTYRAPLKDESEGGLSSGSLKRSHSSPNIAKMVQEEHDSSPGQTIQASRPAMERLGKPKPSHTMATYRTEVSAAKVRNLDPKWSGTQRPGLTGLRNMGNTCYMSSTVQCLASTSPLVTYLLTDTYRQDINSKNFMGTGGRLAEEFAVLVKALWLGSYKSVTPRDLKAAISSHHDLFAGYDQQDSQELLTTLMDALHEDLNKIHNKPVIPDQNNDNIPDCEAAELAWRQHKRRNESVIVEMFQGLFKSTVTCLTCRKQSVTFDVFMYLSVPIPQSGKCSLTDCLREFSREEKMSGDSKWSCPQCRCKRDAAKNIVIWKLPYILIVHLKRFQQKGMWREKITRNVNFPIRGMNFNDYIVGPSTRGRYNLYAISNHYGTIEGGHYTAYCNHPKTKRWYKFDDHEVYEISESDIQSPAGYILYYSCIDMTLR